MKKNSPRIPMMILLMAFLLQACNVKKFIPEGEFLYTGASVDLESPDSLKAEKRIREDVAAVIRPKPNTRILGMRPGLWFHYKAQQEKPGFINKFLNKKLGEEPVYASQVDLDQTRDLILNRLENRGFFFSDVRAALQEDSLAKEAQAHYQVRLPIPIRVAAFQLDADSLPVNAAIEQSLSESLIEKGIRFDLMVLKAERERIDRFLKNRGYYNFNPSFLIFEVDTNRYDTKKFDLFLKLKKEVPQQAGIPYEIERVRIFPNHVIGRDSLYEVTDSVVFNGREYIQDPELFLPKRLDPYLLIEKGQRYNADISRKTSRRLGSIGAYKFVNIRYEEIDSLKTDSLGKLEASIYLTPLNKRAIRAELQAVTKSNNFAGPGLAITFSNRNLFKGGELLNITGKVNYERQIAGGDQEGLSSTQIGLENELIFPRLLFPISIDNNRFQYNIPKTRISLGGNYLNRSKLFTMLSASSRFGYFWDANRYVSHQLDPISVNYVQLSKTSETFERILQENPFLRSSFDQEFIAGLTYSFTYNGMVDQHRRHQFFVNSTLDIAGNSIDLFTGSGAERPQKFLGLEYAQYAKADVDLRYHLNLRGEHKLATRIFAGLGKPYGNSAVLPFTKQYFSGGPFSVRAFRIRSLGPGTYNPEQQDGISYFDQSGNFRLEGNMEYRFPIFSYVKGAAFVDAGNVWNTRVHENLPGGKLSSDFINELGIGGGVGIRVDIQGFVIRFDLAAPFHDPRLPKGARWDMRFDEPILNFAIGYPF